MISRMVPNPVYVLKIDKLEVEPPQAQSSAFVLKTCPALSHIQKEIFPEAGEVPPNPERSLWGSIKEGPRCQRVGSEDIERGQSSVEDFFGWEGDK